MSVKRKKGKTGRPVKVIGEKSTKEKIFYTAIDMFADRGYDGVSIRDIGRSVGITEAAVYKHYSSKDAILRSIFEYMESRIYSPPPEGSIDALIDTNSFQEILLSMPRFMMADPVITKIGRIMLIEMYHNDEIRDFVRKNLFEKPVDEIEALFTMLMKKGEIKPCDPRALSTFFISYLVSWYLQTFILNYDSGLDIERIEKEMDAHITLFVSLLKPEAV